MVYKRDFLFEQVGMGPSGEAVRLNSAISSALKDSRSNFLSNYSDYVALANAAENLARAEENAPLMAMANLLKAKLRKLKIEGSIPVMAFEPNKPDDDEKTFSGPLEPLFPSVKPRTY